MRTAILTDIHANLEALTACIEAAEGQRVDRFVCLGDTVGYGADPNPACDIVRKNALALRTSSASWVYKMQTGTGVMRQPPCCQTALTGAKCETRCLFAVRSRLQFVRRAPG